MSDEMPLGKKKGKILRGKKKEGEAYNSSESPLLSALDA